MARRSVRRQMEWAPVNPTHDQWIELGLDPTQRVLWILFPLTTQRRVQALRSVVRSEGWIVVCPDPRSHSTDVLLGSSLKPQQARDAAAVLRGET